MQIYVHRNNQQLGPFTEAEIKTQLASGIISLQDHVWWQGQANWMPLSQSPLAATLSPTSPSPLPGIPPPVPLNATGPKTSTFAIWSLVCGCLSLILGIIAAIPAIVLGHIGLSETKKNPALSGRGMALTGMIIGYVITSLSVLCFVALIVLFNLGNHVKDTFQTIQAQLNAAENTNSADQSVTTPDQGTNSPDQSTSTTTNSPDQTTNAPDQSAPTTTNSPDQTTNAPDQSAPTTTNSPDQTTNAPDQSAPTTTNSPDQTTDSAPATTNSPDSSTNAPDSSTNAAPMTQ